MLPPNSSLPLITFIFWSWWTLNGVVSDRQINLLSQGCTPSNYFFVLSNFSIFSDNVNKTFREIREQLVNNQNKHFVTAMRVNAENPVFSLFQCRNYLSIHDCVACFDAAAKQIRDCRAGAHGGRVIYDGCFLRYETNAFFDETTENFNAVSCGNQSTRESTEFTSLVQQVLMNLQTTTPKKQGFFAATKAQLPENGSTIYAFAQCTETITQDGCLNCLNTGYNNMLACFPNSDGKAYAAGCFMRYSNTSFFPDNYQTIDVTPLIDKQGSSKKVDIIGGVVGSVACFLILFVLFAWRIRRPNTPKKVPRGEIVGANKLGGLVTYTYRDLKFATNDFDEKNKLGQGGFGVVYKGTLKNGKVVAIKKLTFHQFTKMEEDFESEVKLISNVHHLNLVRLLGCCNEGQNKLLVYEYMKNNSLDKFLFGMARGLAYLHEELHVRIIHRDIKTHNILLDDDLQPRIADFGLARLLPKNKSHLSTKFTGTFLGNHQWSTKQGINHQR
ncbi:cysteine-rich receptor-like protein kinase 2 isoform X2 [Prosopis cineraria]|uniref:cysteine-rich receptor-like protein kinase 2 isoform X2 n=1 Tax=Prosopis cineraria TaxID=364024 RepID=UPI00240FAB88|nr:cysteine-rich receptor-like protein kinase 2 isoform X2 [Prosopis cineraria]